MDEVKIEGADATMIKEYEKPMFDVTIISTSNEIQAKFWMNRLSVGVCKKNCKDTFPMVIGVSEDWDIDGAGNGLGTLYAYKKAHKWAYKLHNIDLTSLLKSKRVSVALFHTSGKGTRLAPLPASENNNKPGVKLPICHRLIDGSFVPITVLEAVIKSTCIYASSRKGRLSVFWGDQIFFPSTPFVYVPTHHIDVICVLQSHSFPTVEEWENKNLENYGIVAISKITKEAAQVEKVDHATAVESLKSFGEIDKIGTSLGSFSISIDFLSALCDEFHKELTSRKGKLDSDPHFWMPLTLPEGNYISLMTQKGIPDKQSLAHYKRMKNFKINFKMNGMGLFGAVDIGKNSYWCDYGQLRFYLTNNLKFLDIDKTSKFLHGFFGLTSNTMESSLGADVKLDKVSKVFASRISSGSICRSLISAVHTIDALLHGSIIINCTAKKIAAEKNSIVYNIIDKSENGITVGEGEVLVGLMNKDGNMVTLSSKLSLCGKFHWKKVVEGNLMSFEQAMYKNLKVDIVKVENKLRQIRLSALSSLVMKYQ